MSRKIDIEKLIKKYFKQSFDIPKYPEKDVLWFKVLLAGEGVLLDIQKIRDKYSIPVRLTDKIQELPTILADDYFEIKDDVVPDIDTNVARKKISEEEYKQEDLFEKDVNKMMVKHSIPSRFLLAMLGFVKFGNVYVVYIGFGDDSSIDVFRYTKKDGRIGVAIDIQPETTIDEIQKNWRAIEERRAKYLGYNPQKRAHIKNIDRNLRIVQLGLSELSSKQIAKAVNSEFPKERVAYAQVPKIINSLKSRSDKTKNSLKVD